MKNKIAILLTLITIFLIGDVFALTQIQNVTVTVLPELSLTIYSPQDKFYGDKQVPINLSTNYPSNITYSLDGKRFITLCRNCSEYGYSKIKRKLFGEGKNGLIIRAVFENGDVINRYVNLTIDSKEPRILKIFPTRGKVTNGSNFYIKYIEENLKEVSINWNPKMVLTDCNESGKNKECYINLDLTSYNGKYIDYYFNVSDYIRSVQSKTMRIFVDATSPVLIINSPITKSYGRKVPFNISISEKVDLEYYDSMELNPKWKNLCSNCNEYGNTRKKSEYFKKGNHDLLIRAVDEAGNSDAVPISFNII